MNLAEISSPQLEALLARSRPMVCLLPFGAVEPHGPHAPLGTDLLISLGMCSRAAAELARDPDVGIVVAPPVPYGVTRYGAAFPGAVGIEEDTLHALACDVGRSLGRQGLRRIVLVNNHFEPEHVATLERVEATLREEGIQARHLRLTRRVHVERLTEEFRSGAAHAGRYETSLVLADAPGQVDQERMRSLEPLPLDMPAAMAEGRRDFLSMGMSEAYCGAPAQATAEEGEETFATLTAILLEAVRMLAA
jgi:creatinine amidohydrolase